METTVVCWDDIGVMSAGSTEQIDSTSRGYKAIFAGKSPEFLVGYPCT